MEVGSVMDISGVVQLWGEGNGGGCMNYWRNRVGLSSSELQRQQIYRSSKLMVHGNIISGIFPK